MVIVKRRHQALPRSGCPRPDIHVALAVRPKLEQNRHLCIAGRYCELLASLSTFNLYVNLLDLYYMGQFHNTLYIVSYLNYDLGTIISIWWILTR